MVVIDKIAETTSGLDENVNELHKVQEIISQNQSDSCLLSHLSTLASQTGETNDGYAPANEKNKCGENHAPKINIKRIKLLLLIFLKQFDIDEYKFLIKFLDILFIKYLNDPMKIFVYLTKSNSAKKREENFELKQALDDDEDINYLDEYKSDIIESFLMKDNDDDQACQDESFQMNKSQNNNKDDEEVSDLDQDNLDEFNYYYSNRENENNDDELELEEEDGEESASFSENVEEKAPNKKRNTNGTIRVRKFSESIRVELERKFLKNNFISGPEKTKLARSLNLSERQVQKWFVHRREKLRRRSRLSESFLKKVEIESDQTESVSEIQDTKSVESASVDQNEKSLNGELLHEDEEKTDVNKRRAVSNKKSLDKHDRDVSVKSSNRSLRPKNTISYEEEPLKTPPAKRKCNSSKLDIPSKVASYLEKLVQGNKFLKDKQIMDISKETGQTETQIREWLKERSLRSSLDESQSECSRGRRRVSRHAF